MSVVAETGLAVMNSVTGHDEMAIAQHFGQSFSWLIDNDELTLARALVFVTKRRGENKLNDDDAREFALSMPFGDLKNYFADESDETDDEGKDDEASEPQPVTSLHSAS